jgi:hypothetical protein
MADPDSLVKGNCYFHVGYVDSDLLIPVIDTFIFIEKVDKEDKYWLFQDAESFASQSEDPDYLAVPEEQLYTMLDISELRTHLKGLLHLHPIVGNTPSRKVLLTEKNKSIILKQIKNILNKSDPSNSLTITTNYRDKGVSLNYEEGGIVITMFLDCKEEPEEEIIVRQIFSDLGISPTTDYLAQHDRVRVNSYFVSGSANIIANIIGEIFIKAYKIRENEKIYPHFRLQTN